MSLQRPVCAPLTGPPVSAPRPPHLNPSASLRHAHVLRLHDLVNHLVALPPSYANSTRALRAWRALATCKEVDMGALWRLGSSVVERLVDGDRDEHRERHMARKAAWVKACQDNRLAKVDKTNEYVLALVAAGRPKQALDELDAVLPAHPYNESITLNVMGGFLALQLAQPPASRHVDDDDDSSDSSASSSSARSDKSSDDDDIQKSQVDTDEEEAAKRVAALGTPRKRARGPATVDDSLTAYLRLCQANSPALFELAKQRFRRAAHLERTEYDSGDSDGDDAGPANPAKVGSGGEGSRWLALLDFDLSDTRKKRRR